MRMSRVLVMGLAALSAVGGLSACGPVPHPFERVQGDRNDLIDDPRALAPVSIRADDMPGLAEEMIKALEQEEVPASLVPPLPGRKDRYLLVGRKDGNALVWTLTNPVGKALGESRQSIGAGTPGAMNADLAARSAPVISDLIRGSDAGVADLANRTRVFVRPLTTPRDIDGSALRSAMSAALAGQNFAMTDENPAFFLDGEIKIMPGTAKQVLLEVTWYVKDAKGEELAKVSQGGPTDSLMAMGDLGPLARKIATAGAPGIAQVLRNPAPPDAPAANTPTNGGGLAMPPGDKRPEDKPKSGK